MLLFFFCTATDGFAQESIATKFDQPDCRRVWSLELGLAQGTAMFRDMGTAPISFNGILLQPYLGLHLGLGGKADISLISHTGIGFFEDAPKPDLNFSSYDIHNSLSLRYMGRVKPRSQTVNLFLGAALTNFIDITVNPNYENSAAGISEFLGPEAIFRVHLMPRWSAPMLFHGELSLMPLAAVCRPGYSYIDNYTAQQPVIDALFSNFQWNIKPFAAITTDIGFDVVTGSGSHITLSYLWSYHTTGNSGYWRFDHATHTIAVDFFIKLKEKRL